MRLFSLTTYWRRWYSRRSAGMRSRSTDALRRVLAAAARGRGRRALTESLRALAGTGGSQESWQLSSSTWSRNLRRIRAWNSSRLVHVVSCASCARRVKARLSPASKKASEGEASPPLSWRSSAAENLALGSMKASEGEAAYSQEGQKLEGWSQPAAAEGKGRQAKVSNQRESC